MLKEWRSRIGKTGNTWLDTKAWFTAAHVGQTLDELRASDQSIEELLHAEETRLLPEETNGLKEIQAQPSKSCIWAFPGFHDAFVIMLKREKPNTESEPKDVYEMQRRKLYERIPIYRGSQSEMIIFEAEIICRDPRFGANPGPATVATETGLHHLPIEEWGKYPTHGFKYGLCLVQPKSDGPFYRLSKNTVFKLWSDSRGTDKPHKMVSPKLVIPVVQKSLPGVIKELYGVDPGERS